MIEDYDKAIAELLDGSVHERLAQAVFADWKLLDEESRTAMLPIAIDWGLSGMLLSRLYLTLDSGDRERLRAMILEKYDFELPIIRLKEDEKVTSTTQERQTTPVQRGRKLSPEEREMLHWVDENSHRRGLSFSDFRFDPSDDPYSKTLAPKYLQAQEALQSLRHMALIARVPKAGLRLTPRGEAHLGDDS